MSHAKPHEEHRKVAPRVVQCAVVTVSDTRTPETDYGGRTVAYTLVDAGHRVVRRWIVRDEPDEIRDALAEGIDDKEIEAIFFTGGTGIAKRDVTYEVVEAALEKTIPGFGELFRYLSFKEIGPSAMMSRAIAGTAGGKLIVSLPGSMDACHLAMQKLLIPEIGHMVQQLKK
jgi:molybdenum cofactor biosynthesis protein B